MSSSYFPQQPPLAPAQQFESLPPPPPYEPYQSSFPPPPQNPQQYQQPEAQASFYQAPWNTPPTSVYIPSPYAHSDSQSQVSSAPKTQYFPPPSQNPPNQQQQPFGNGSQAAYNLPPVNAPPTPVFTPGPHGSSAPNNGESTPQVFSPPTTQYFPPPPQNQPSPQQQLFGSGSQPTYNQPLVNCPPTLAFTPVSSGDPGPSLAESSILATQYCPPPPQVQPTLQHPPVINNSQPVYYQTPANPFPNPPPNPSHADITQSPQNGYPAENKQFPRTQPQNAPPIPYSQAPPVILVQPTCNQPPVNIQSNPLSPPPSTPQLYFGPGQLPQASYPAEKVQFQQQQPQIQQRPQILLVSQQQSFNNPLILQTQQIVSPAFPPVSGTLPPAASPSPAKDDLKSSKTKRFFGDTLVGRAARSSVSTVTSTVKLPASLSPWGDNNPVTLPNVRYRDAALFATFHVIGGPVVDGVGNLVTDAFGADTFVSEIVSSGAEFINGNPVVKFGVFQIVEQAIDKGVLERVLPEVEKTMRATTAKSLQVAIKHKLMGVEADLRFVGTYPATSLTAYNKGWFCPYLYASSREPVISRSRDFAIAQFFGPYVTADTALTHKLLTESASVIPLCDPNPTLQLQHSRLLVLFAGITPFRAGMWSTSRRPGCAQLIFHLPNGCPALVLPACTAQTPVLAWSPWTLNQMQNFGASGYKPETQHREITDWLMGLVERQGLYPCIRDVHGAFERIMGKVVTMIINGARAAPKSVNGRVFEKVDVERAGVVMFRY